MKHVKHALLLPLLLLTVSPAVAADRSRSLMEQLEAIAPAAFRGGSRTERGRDARSIRGPQSTRPEEIRVIPYRGT
jgi:hypothetical protein